MKIFPSFRLDEILDVLGFCDFHFSLDGKSETRYWWTPSLKYPRLCVLRAVTFVTNFSVGETNFTTFKLLQNKLIICKGEFTSSSELGSMAVAVAQKGSLSSPHIYFKFANYHVRSLEWIEIEPPVAGSCCDLLDVEILLHVGNLLSDCLDKVVMTRDIWGHYRELLPIVSEQGRIWGWLDLDHHDFWLSPDEDGHHGRHLVLDAGGELDPELRLERLREISPSDNLINVDVKTSY